jgi:hypothetical protein
MTFSSALASAPSPATRASSLVRSTAASRAVRERQRSSARLRDIIVTYALSGPRRASYELGLSQSCMNTSCTTSSAAASSRSTRRAAAIACGASCR